MRSHIFIHLATTISFAKHFIFKIKIVKRKDFQEVARLAWAQEVPSSNLGAATNLCFLFPHYVETPAFLLKPL
jgi:hypothetical protein